MKETKKLLIVANLIAIAIAIDVITSMFNLRMPFGGNFIGISMLPLILIGLFFGLKYGLISGFIYALYNFTSDYIIYIDALRLTLESWTGITWTFWHILGLVFLDYIIPFMAFGLSGLFADGFKSKAKFVYAALTVSAIRLFSSTFAGTLLWGSSIKYAASSNDEDARFAVSIFKFVDNNLFLYSLLYNLTYILTSTALVILIGLAIHKRMSDITEQFIGKVSQ
ncbi:MAG: energy-coupled thiamine transporter ThiT [Acholeplasmataceae bacterium]